MTWSYSCGSSWTFLKLSWEYYIHYWNNLVFWLLRVDLRHHWMLPLGIRNGVIEVYNYYLFITHYENMVDSDLLSRDLIIQDPDHDKSRTLAATSDVKIRSSCQWRSWAQLLLTRSCVTTALIAWKEIGNWLQSTPPHWASSGTSNQIMVTNAPVRILHSGTTS